MYRTTMLASLFLLSLTGCAPSPPKPEELGRVVYDPTQVPGMDKPYRAPERDKLPTSDKAPAPDKLPGIDRGKAAPDEKGDDVKTP
ncbi:MAG TPA: hypothetical protein VMV69_27720 [Pirellulales bacterium]|nr:hypothetical protein [Pirellulales bacterium]